MRRISAFFTFLLLAGIALAVFSPSARAEDPAAVDPAAEDSEAARTYRDAWWTETATGDLDRALELYGLVEGLEGSAHTKAQALYRKGVVLERLGRTEEAIQVFERLAKRYPDEKELLAAARERLEAWTAEDLEGSFDDWYARYQYSPEFQAKVVDLVLRLGTQRWNPREGVPAEEKELLTIGEAAKPALRRHLDTSNENLRGWVTALLLQLGEVPPADALLATDIWLDRKGAWSTLLTLPQAKAEALADALPAEGERAAVLRAVLQGPDAALALFQASERGDFFDREVGSDLMLTLFKMPGGRPSVDAFAKFVESASPWVDERWARGVVYRLDEAPRLPDAVLLRLLADGPAWSRGAAVTLLVQGKFVHPDAWRALARGIVAEHGNLRATPNLQLADALVRAVAEADADDLTPAVEALERWVAEYPNWNVAGNPSMDPARLAAGLRRLAPAVLETSRSLDLKRQILQGLGYLTHPGAPSYDPEVYPYLLRLALESPDASVREMAAYQVASALGNGAPVDPALEALATLTAAPAQHVIGGLGSRATSFQGEPARIDRLLEAAQRLEGSDAQGRANRVFSQLFRTPEGVGEVFDEVAAQPAQRWAEVFRVVPVETEVRKSPDLQAHIRDILRARWNAWSPAERAAIAEGLGGFLRGFEDDADFDAWIRARIRDADGGGDAELQLGIRRALLAALDAITLDNLRAVYDLADPAQAMEASRWGGAPRTLEVYQALAAARRYPDVSERDRFWDRWSDGKRVEAGVRHVVARDMLEEPQAHARQNAIGRLKEFRDPQDVPRLVKALTDEDAVVRRLAAEALQSVYDTSALVALAAALDDPDPAVREQVLQTLEAIKKAEELKDYWRTFAEERKDR